MNLSLLVGLRGRLLVLGTSLGLPRMFVNKGLGAPSPRLKWVDLTMLAGAFPGHFGAWVS